MGVGEGDSVKGGSLIMALMEDIINRKGIQGKTIGKIN